MATFRIKHLLDDDRITTCNNDFEFIQFVNLIQTENDDELTYDVDSAIDYINLTCDNLDFETEEEDETEEEKFEFKLFQKHTIWMSTSFDVSAKSEEDARQKALEMYREDNITEHSWEYLYDTLCEMDPDETHGLSTLEIRLDGDLIFENGE